MSDKCDDKNVADGGQSAQQVQEALNEQERNQFLELIADIEADPAKLRLVQELTFTCQGGDAGVTVTISLGPYQSVEDLRATLSGASGRDVATRQRQLATVSKGRRSLIRAVRRLDDSDWTATVAVIARVLMPTMADSCQHSERVAEDLAKEILSVLGSAS